MVRTDLIAAVENDLSSGNYGLSARSDILIEQHRPIHYIQPMKPIPVTVAAIAAAFLAAAPAALGQTADRPSLVLDENVWVTFYDLPSRRFRGIRDAFLKRDFDTVGRDLDATLGFLRVEAGQAVEQLAPAFAENIGRLERVRADLASNDVTVSDLDVLFAQSHWILSQHYLVEALESRDENQHRLAGRYLIATAHHLERAVLWSDLRIDRDVLNSLENVRGMASELAGGADPDRVYRNRPMRLMARTLEKTGEHIDRRVRIAPLLPE